MHICFYKMGQWLNMQVATVCDVCLLKHLTGASQLEELQKVKIPTSIKVTPIRGGILDNWD